VIVSLSATGIANPARCNRAAASASSIAGETRGLTPPSSASSASNSVVRSSTGEKGGRGLGGDDLHGAGALHQRAGERAVARAEIEGDRELAADQIEPIEQPVGDFGMQKIGGACCVLSKSGGAVAVQAPGTPIEQRQCPAGRRHRGGAQSAGVS
jgi:hypothetical protein